MRPTWWSEPTNRITSAEAAASAGSANPGASSDSTGLPVGGLTHTEIDTSRIATGQAMSLNTVATWEVEPSTLKMSPTVFSA